MTLLIVGACSVPDDEPFERSLPLTPGVDVTSPGGTPTPPEPTVPPPLDRCAARPAQDVPCIDADLVAPLWTLDPDYEYVDSVRVEKDVNGDGLLDAELDVRHEGACCTSDVIVVYAPLVRELVLPRDADLHVVESRYCWWGDYTADGETDALCQATDPTAPVFYTEEALGLVAGPLAQVIDPDLDSAVIVPAYKSWRALDTNFDGLIEPAVPSTGRVELWRGQDPSTWMIGTPDLTLQFPCQTDPGEDFSDPWVVVCNNDDEGDGVMDLAVGLTYGSSDCDGDQTYIVPAQTVGFVDLGASPIARKGFCLNAVDDQDLDGVVDFDAGYSVDAGPATWVDGTPVSPELFTIPYDFRYAQWTGVDFTGDGIDDWWDQRWLPGDIDVPYVILSGGAGGGISTGLPTWHVFSAVDPESAYSEDGTNYMVFTDDFTGVRFVPIE